MKKRTEQQMIDPYDIPSTKVSTVYVEECDNITEEIEITLEELKKKVDATQNLKDMIRSKRRSKDEKR
tara:strand:- start:130 stop:333 length:204 start_codon:yes stop_codon:yes gene_type:complete